MKNRRIFFVMVTIAICMSLSACTATKRPSKVNEEKIQFLNMQTSAFEAAFNLGESNRYMIEAYYAKDSKEAKEYIDKSLNLLIEADEKMENVISSPNFLEKEMEKLQENYKKTSNMRNKLSDASAEEINLIEEGAVSHVYLLKCLHSFSYLYCIREFDNLPEKEANKCLKETWWRFGFEENIECPDTIEKQELYHIWARQWLETELTQETIEKIEKLRKADDLQSKECNKKWIDFINEFCSKENMDTN